MMEEVWKPIEGFESQYEVSNMGRVRVIRTGQHSRNGVILRGYVMKNGYHAVTLNLGGVKVNGVRKKLSTHRLRHRLVAEAFIPNPHNLPCINHIDEDKRNNCVTNLEWCTHHQNMMHNGLGRRIAKKNGRRIGKFSKDGTLIREYYCSEEASRIEGYGATSIRNWLNGVYPCSFGFIWKYID